MSRVEQKIVGSGLTRHTARRRVFDGPGEKGDPEKLHEALAAAAKANQPWGWLEREIGIARRTLAAIEAGAPGSESPNLFAPHEGAGWYSREILRRTDRIQRADKLGATEEVARVAYQLGQLAATIRLKNAWDEDIEFRLELQQRQQTSKPKRSDEERYECWQRHYALTGKKTEADRLAAIELGDGESTIRGARMRIAAGASD